jgi:hypothetical protein
MSENQPIEEAFTEEEMRLAGIYCRAVTGGPTDFDREVQEHLDRLARKRTKREASHSAEANHGEHHPDPHLVWGGSGLGP